MIHIRNLTAYAALAAASLLLAGTPTAAKTMSDAAIKQAIIRESIASYPGNCPCPYNSASNGSSCGRRSAYSRPGGYAPMCYARDVSKQQVEEYRRSHNVTKP
jgi:hypothetical protein